MAKSSQQIFVEVAQALNSTKKKEKLVSLFVIVFFIFYPNYISKNLFYLCRMLLTI